MDEKIPKIEGIVRSDTQEIERFQNEVLRPIIKAKHDLLISVFQSFSEKRKKILTEMDAEALETHIKITCKRDLEFRNQVVGIIIGNFDVQEHKRYMDSESEYKRRILQIVKKRLLDSQSELM